MTAVPEKLHQHTESTSDVTLHIICLPSPHVPGDLHRKGRILPPSATFNHSQKGPATRSNLKFQVILKQPFRP